MRGVGDRQSCRYAQFGQENRAHTPDAEPAAVTMATRPERSKGAINRVTSNRRLSEAPCAGDRRNPGGSVIGVDLNRRGQARHVVQRAGLDQHQARHRRHLREDRRAAVAAEVAQLRLAAVAVVGEDLGQAGLFVVGSGTPRLAENTPPPCFWQWVQSRTAAIIGSLFSV